MAKTPSPYRLNWETNRLYTAGEVSVVSGYKIICLTTHTSGTYATDVASGYWQMEAPWKNAVINGGFDIWQRGASISLATAPAGTTKYSADRWKLFSNGSTATVSRVSGTVSNSLYGMKVQRDNASSSTSQIYCMNVFESAVSKFYAGKSVTLSFWAKAGTNLSSTSGNVSFLTRFGTGTDQDNVASWTIGTDFQNTVSLTTTLTKYNFTMAAPTNTNQIALSFTFVPTGTAGADDSFTVEQVMLNEGPAPAAFQTAAPNIQAELAMCQRYYYRPNYGDIVSAQIAYGSFQCVSTTLINGAFNLPSMRAMPVIATSTIGKLAAISASGTQLALTAMSIDSGQLGTVGPYNALRLSASVASGLVAGNMTEIRRNSDASGWFDFSAEL